MSARQQIARIHGGFHVVVPLEYSSVGILPPDWFIVSLMQHRDRLFYVGGLSAAEHYGAAHQRPQWYQVVTDRPLRSIECRGVGIHFLVKHEACKTPVRQIKGVTGYIPVSTPEATALDLVRYSRRVGGLDHVLTVLQELGEAMAAADLVVAAEADGCLVHAQRLGWLLERAGHADKAKALARWVATQAPSPGRLDPSLPVRGADRDPRWHLWVNTEVEGDLP